MSKFEKDKTYVGRSVCQMDSEFKITVKKRTACSIVTTDNKRMKIHQTDSGEMVFPCGNYSMAVVIRASSVV